MAGLEGTSKETSRQFAIGRPPQGKAAPKQPPKPFSREEIGAIILAFRSDRYYCYYADFVEFLFGTGCRTGEAIGLRWKHLSDDCSTVWIKESLSCGIRKRTKTNRSRTITLTPILQAMLLDRKPADISPDNLVFTTASGKSIDDNNFRNRAWKTVAANLDLFSVWSSSFVRTVTLQRLFTHLNHYDASLPNV